MTTTTTAPALATDRQLAFADKLYKEREVPVAGKTPEEGRLIELAFDMGTGKDVTRKEASQVIDYLLSLPKPAAAPKPAPTQAVALDAGIYKAPNEDVIKVKKTRDGKRLYAQVLVAKGGQARINLNDEVIPNFDFVYVPGLIAHITPEMKLTLDEAKEFYTKTGRCLNCKKELKVAASIAKGLGPTCAKMFA